MRKKIFQWLEENLALLLLILAGVCVVVLFIVMLIEGISTPIEESITQGSVVECSEVTEYYYLPYYEGPLAHKFVKKYEIAIKMEDNTLFTTRELNFYKIGSTVNVRKIKKGNEISYFLLD